MPTPSGGRSGARKRQKTPYAMKPTPTAPTSSGPRSSASSAWRAPSSPPAASASRAHRGDDQQHADDRSARCPSRRSRRDRGAATLRPMPCSGIVDLAAEAAPSAHHDERDAADPDAEPDEPEHDRAAGNGEQPAAGVLGRLLRVDPGAEGDGCRDQPERDEDRPPDPIRRCADPTSSRPRRSSVGRGAHEDALEQLPDPERAQGDREDPQHDEAERGRGDRLERAGLVGLAVAAERRRRARSRR